MKSSNIRNNSDISLLKFVEEALAYRCSATVTLMKSLQETISLQKTRSESLTLALNGQKSNEGRKGKFYLFPSYLLRTYVLFPFHVWLNCIFFYIRCYWLNCVFFILDVIVALQNHNNCLKDVAENASQAISIINEKHKRYLDEIEVSKSNHSRELQEIKHISGIEITHLASVWVSIRI